MGTEIIKFNDDGREVTFLDITSIQDIKENELFGIMVSKFNMSVIYPDVNFYDNGNISYDFGIDDEFIKMHKNYPEKIGAIVGGEDVPLIMRKLKDNLAQEVLSGEIFIIDGLLNPFKDNNGIYNAVNNYNIKSFQNNASKFEKSNVILSCVAEKYKPIDVKGEKIEWHEHAYIVVDDYFKYLYSEETLSRKDDIIAALKYIKTIARTKYYEEYKESINAIQSVANTDNLLYDLEHSTPEDKPKRR